MILFIHARKWMIKIFLLIVGLIFLLSFLFVASYISIKKSIPDDGALSKIENVQASKVFSEDGQLLGKYFILDRIPLSIDNVAPHISHALISTEDIRFYEHDGIDWLSMPRVLIKSLILGDRSSGGGSTITQQLVKNTFGRETFESFSLYKNKLREMMIARKLEHIYSKEEILTMYLNTVPFGEETFGIESASNRYFQKTAAELNVQEAATLIGMLKATSYYNPRLFPDRTLGRRNVVLDQLAIAGYYSAQQMDSVAELPLQVNYLRLDQNTGLATYFREQVRIETLQILKGLSDEKGDIYNIYTDGLQIHTTLNAQMQQYAEAAAKRHLSKLQSYLDKHWQNQVKPWETNESIINLELSKAGYKGSSAGTNFDDNSINKAIREEREMEVFTWTGPETKMMSPLDSIKYYLKFLNTGVLAIEPQSGRVKVWVGGIDHNYFKYDHVNKGTKRQVGSTFKPIVYTAALEQGISPCKYIKANQEIFTENEKNWTPANADLKYDGKYSMEGGLINSVNTVSVKIIESAGIENTITLARNMGIESEIPPYPSIALGTPSISLFEMVTAYCNYPNYGVSINPYFIEYIEDKDGNIIWENESHKGSRCMSEESAMLMIHMMQNVVNQGTGSSLRSTYMLKNDFAGKTGTTQNNADGWFIGMTPRLVTGIWVGGAYPSVHFRSTRMGQGASTALPIFGLFYQQLNKDPQFRHLTKSNFKRTPAYLKEELDCDPFKEEFKLFEWLFGNKKKEKETKPKKEKKGVFKKIGSFFKKKK